jgi:VCBS repeat protein
VGREWGEPSAPPPAHDRAFDEYLLRQHQAEQDRRAQRNTPEAKQQRARSRAAFRGANRAEALDLARREFPSLFAQRIARSPEARSGERIEKYLNASAYMLETPDGKRYLVQSTQPVATADASGRLSPIDTRLEQQGDGFRATHPLAPVTVSSRADGAHTLTRAGVGFRLPDAAGSSATATDDKAFYPNALADSDVTVAPVTGGLEVLVQLRSAESPERVAIDFSLPPGASMRLTDGSGVLANPLPPADEKGVEIVDHGEVAATVAPPSAIDADGQKVPAHYELDGSRLSVVVDHRSGDFRYPILIDPYVVDLFAWRDSGGQAGSASASGWGSRQYASGYTFADCSTSDFFWCSANGALNGIGLYIKGQAGSWSPAGWWGEWYFQAPGGANIVRVDWRQAGMTTFGNSCMYAYITGPTSNSSGNRYTNCSNWGSPNWYPVSCTDTANPCATGGSASGNYAVFGLQIWNGSYVDIWAMLGGAYVNMWEGWRPTITSITNRPSGWVDNESRTFSAAVHDDGLGVHNAQLLIDGTATSQSGVINCNGSFQSKCPADNTFTDWSYSTTSLSEGVHRAEVQAQDVIGNTSLPDANSTFDIKVDRTPPNVALSGALYDRRGQELPPGSYTLHVDATDGDGTPSGSRSGVHIVTFYVDGEEQDAITQSCTAGNCQLHKDFTYDTSEFGGGPHDVHVVATDELGHERETAAFTVNQPCCLTASAAWGTYPPATSDFALGDVDGDAAADAVVRDRALGTVSVGLSTEGGFAPLSSWGSFPVLNDIHLADVNGDGRDDLVGRPAGGSDVQVALSSGTSFAAPVSWGSFPPTHSLYTADMDGDGLADVAGRSSAGDFIVAYSRETSFGGAYSWGSFDPAYELSLADVDGDDGADLVGRNAATGDVRVAISQAGHLDPASSWASVPAGSDVAFGDGDGDGPADLIVRDPITGAISFHSSNASGFRPASAWGTFDSSHELGAGDVDGDGQADLAGRRALTGDVLVAQSRAPFPDLPLAEDYVPVPADIESEPPAEETGTAQAKAAAASTAPTDLKIAFQDDRRLLTRTRLVEPDRFTDWRNPWEEGSAAQATAVGRINQIYDRMAQAGASIVRFNVEWSHTENRPDPTHPSGYAGGKRYFFDRLDAAVKLARAKHFDVQLTITGGGDTVGACPNYDQIGHYNPNARVCDPNNRSTLVNPDPADYGNFVREVVEHYTRAGDHSPLPASDPLLVKYFSFWNEPNSSNFQFLKTANEREIPIHLYHDLVVNGWNAYSASIGATPKVNGTKAFVGELSSVAITGYIDGHPDCHLGQEKDKCKLSPREFIARVARAGGGSIVADGLAHHPYQETAPPWTRGYGKRQGIGKLDEVKHALDDLCEWSQANKQCMGPLRGPHQKELRLYLTEFGYRNRPTDKHAAATNGKPPNEKAGYRNYWHTEKRRALWFRGGRVKGVSRKGAFGKAHAPDVQVADWLLLYHATELQLAEEDPEDQPFARRNLWDSGLIGRPGIDNPDDDVTGVRPYGKRYGYRGFRHSQKRLAYCAIRAWARQAGYPGTRAKNGCP